MIFSLCQTSLCLCYQFVVAIRYFGYFKCMFSFSFLSTHRGKILNPSPEENKSPVCIYLTQEVIFVIF